MSSLLQGKKGSSDYHTNLISFLKISYCMDLKFGKTNFFVFFSSFSDMEKYSKATYLAALVLC